MGDRRKILLVIGAAGALLASCATPGSEADANAAKIAAELGTRLSYHNSVHDGTPSQMSCPDTPPISYAPTTMPTLPQDIDTLISNALPRIPAGGTATEAMLAQVRSAVNGWQLDPGVRRDVTLSGNAIGVAVRTPDECDLGMAAPGITKAWPVPSVEYQPGELICSAEEAATGQGQTSPH